MKGIDPIRKAAEDVGWGLDRRPTVSGVAVAVDWVGGSDSVYLV